LLPEGLWQVTANNVFRNATSFWALLTNVTAAAGVPWVAIFGNHDDQPLDFPASTSIFNVSKETPAQTSRFDLLSFDTSHDLSLSVSSYKSTSGGWSIGFLTVATSYNWAKPAAVLWFLDTGGGSLQQVLEEVLPSLTCA